LRRIPAIERLCAIATAAALVPIWLFRWFPTQDGPSHLYNAYVLSHYHDATSTILPQYFVLNLRPFPNWTTYALSAVLVRVFPPIVVQQIILSICVIGVPLGVLYLQKSFKPAADPTALLGVLLAYSYLFFMGFFNFVIGAALFAFACGFWWRRRDGKYLYGLYALLIATYFSHDLAFGVTLMAIAVLAMMERRWRVLVELSPAAVLFLIDAFSRPRGAPLFRTFRWHVRQLVTVFSAGHIAIAFLTLLVVLLGIVWAFVRRRPNAFALISLIIFITYFVAPWSYASAGWIQAGWINERLLFLTILTLPAWIVLPRPEVSMYALLVAVVAHLAATTMQIAALHRFIADYARAAALIRPHSTIRTYFPISGVSPQVTPTLHLTAYLGLQADVVDLDDYEGYLPDFPVAYRAQIPSRPPDYVVAWKRADVPPLPGYSVIFENVAVRRYQRGANF
jgi:hypothetical protein